MNPPVLHAAAVNWQTIVVALLVLGCSVYAVWTLMPRVARRALARWLLRMPWPQRLSTPLRRAAAEASGCGCAGCEHAAPPPGVTGAPQPIVVHRGLPR